jgi:hypothetical protein
MYPSDKESRPTRHVEVVGAETDEERRNRLMFWLTICGLCLIAGMGLDACVATYFRADSTYRPLHQRGDSRCRRQRLTRSYRCWS